jgi:hypothetical protein
MTLAFQLMVMRFNNMATTNVSRLHSNPWRLIATSQVRARSIYSLPSLTCPAVPHSHRRLICSLELVKAGQCHGFSSLDYDATMVRRLVPDCELREDPKRRIAFPATSTLSL